MIPHPANAAVDERWRSFTPDDELLAPSLLTAECTSVLNAQVHRGRIDAASGRRQIEKMLRLPIHLVHGAPLYLRAFDIARSLGWAKAYDALYLAAADSEAAELLTLDGGLLDAAARLSIRATHVAG